MWCKLFSVVVFVIANGSTHVISDGPPFSVTLVTQTSSDRIWMLEDICERWPGPIALAVFVFPLNNRTGAHSDLNNKYDLHIPSVCNKRVAHVVYIAKSVDEQKEYPVNILRNSALDLVRSTHIFMVPPTHLPVLLPVLPIITRHI